MKMAMINLWNSTRNVRAIRMFTCLKFGEFKLRVQMAEFDKNYT